MIETGLYTHVFEERDASKEYQSPEDPQALLRVMPKGVPRDLNTGISYAPSYTA
jgi:hypothetical protein